MLSQFWAIKTKLMYVWNIWQMKDIASEYVLET